ncbi:hypothetical protein, partial [Guyparkeria sp.]|uniref:hypothetical protein n=1 Tax=Guyparkeria sp. TaxID=2035736 RepID=UPI003970E582
MFIAPASFRLIPFALLIALLAGCAQSPLLEDGCHVGAIEGPAREYLNAQRVQAGLNPVSVDSTLGVAAEAH